MKVIGIPHFDLVPGLQRSGCAWFRPCVFDAHPERWVDSRPFQYERRVPVT